MMARGLLSSFGLRPVSLRNLGVRTALHSRRLVPRCSIAVHPPQTPSVNKYSVCADSKQELMKELDVRLGRLSPAPLVPPPSPVVIVVSGPSGVGKDAVILQLKEERPDLYFVVTATSRPMRVGELEGRDYFFVDKAKFEDWIEHGQLLEHALVYGEYKGIPRQQVDQALQRGTDVVLRLDVQGAATIKRLLPNCITIFIAAESEEELVHRLVARKTEPLAYAAQDKLIVRIATARKELACIQDFDYVVVNSTGKLHECAAQLSTIIDAEKLKVRRRMPHDAQCEQLSM